MNSIRKFILSNWVFIVWLILSTGLIFIVGNPYDTGDSIQHYQISRFSFRHPWLFLDHWGKPVFTLLSSPFAQFGLRGMFLFNVICLSLSLLLIQAATENRNAYKRLLPFLLTALAPSLFLVQYSGLTEPLAGLMIAAIICLFSKDRITSALLIAGFIPLVRTEMILVTMIAAAWAALLGHFRKIPWVFSGFVLFSLLGILAGKSPLWLIESHPYSGKAEQYGHGDWLHYPVQMWYLFFPAFCGLLLYSIVRLGTDAPLKNFSKRKTEWLALKIFLGLLLFHVISWRFGWFRTAGMQRVLVPLAVPALFLISRMWNPQQLLFIMLPVAVMAITLFTVRPAGWWHRSLEESPEQQSAKAMTERRLQLIQQAPRVYYMDPWFIHCSGIDPYAGQARLMPSYFAEPVPTGSVVYWEPGISEGDFGYSREKIFSRTAVQLIDSALWGNGRKSYLYQVLQSTH